MSQKLPPDVLKKQFDRKVRRAILLKLERKLINLGHQFDSLAASLRHDDQLLQDYSYTSKKLPYIVHALEVLRKHLLLEAETIQRKSKFPPQ